MNPESGTTGYTYDLNGNLKTRTEARSKVLTLNYDGLNRLSGKTYSDSTPGVTYGYLGVTNFLKSVSSSASAYTYSGHDALGRPASGIQTTGGQTFPFLVSWTPQGQVKQLTYPSGRVVTTSFDGAGRSNGLSGVLGAAAAVPYVAGVGYAAHGGLASLTTGDSVVRTLGYKNRLQMSSVSAVQGSTNLMALTFGYPATGNNGRVVSQQIVRGSLNTTQTYFYDTDDRLCAAAEGGAALSTCTAPTSGNNWRQSYVFDKVGNRAVTGNSSMLVSNYTPQSPDGISVPFSAATNRWNLAAGYDAAGNMTSVATQTMVYDAEGRMTSWADSALPPSSASFTYDGDGRRVTKTAGAGTITYVYDPAGQMAAEYGGRAPATMGTTYLTQDHLGSTRLVTNSGGVVGCHDYLPFGEEIPGTGAWGRSASCFGAVDTDVKFTGQIHDAETGLDYFEHRYMSSAQGRFTSPDPVFANVHRLFDPQQWNLYAYVRNNPLNLTDPTGLDFYQTCQHSDSNGSTCHEVQNGSAKTWVTGTTDSKENFTANRIANDANGNLVDVAHGNAAVTGSFDQSGVHLNGSNGQFIEGSNANKIGGSGTFAGITGNFFSACGGSCQARGTLTGTADAFTHMKAGLVQQGYFRSFLDGFSGAHPFQTTQWKDAGGYGHLINSPGFIMDMHFEGSSTGGGLEQFILHSVGTISDLASGAAAKQKGMMTPGKDPDEK